MGKLKKVIAGVLVVSLIGAGATGALFYMKKSNQKEIMVVDVSSLKSEYYMPSTTLEGYVTTSVSQNITVEDDMIIEEVYVQAGDSVSVGDPLISFDMTLVEMELKIARLRNQQIDQQLDKAVDRLNSLKNGGPIEVEDDSLGGIGGSSSDDLDSTLNSDDELAAVSGGMEGGYLAAAVNPLLLASFTDGGAFTDGDVMFEEVPAATPTPIATPTPTLTPVPDPETPSEDNTSQGGFGDNDIQYQEPADGDFSDGAVEGDEILGEEDDTIPPDFQGGEGSGGFGSIDDTGAFTDGEGYFYQVLDYESEPYSGTGTEEDPYIFLCSSTTGSVKVKGSFFNKMAGYNEDGTKVEYEGGSWFQLEFHDMDYVSDPSNRIASCTGYYLIDGGMLEEPANPESEMEFTLEEATQMESLQEFPDGMGEYDSNDTSIPTMSREDAIKSQQTVISGLELDRKENDLNITKLEKRVNRKNIYSKLDGTVAYMGDPITGNTTEDAFMKIKSKDGYFVTGTVSELMLDQVQEGTILNCMSYESGNFPAEVLEVSDYPISSSGGYMGNGNPNVSYYTYSAEVTDPSIQLRDQDWLTVTLQTDVAVEGSMVLPKAFVRTENGSSYVYKDENGLLKKQAVDVGANVDGGYSVMIKGGISDDDKIAFPYGKDVVEGAKTVDGTLEEMYGY